MLPQGEQMTSKGFLYVNHNLDLMASLNLIPWDCSAVRKPHNLQHLSATTLQTETCRSHNYVGKVQRKNNEAAIPP